MDLMVTLAAVDRVTGNRQMKQLSNGWMGWESKVGRRVRAALAHGLVALAARIAPVAPVPAALAGQQAA